MAAAAGNFGSILSNGVGQYPAATPDFVEVLTAGWFAGVATVFSLSGTLVAGPARAIGHFSIPFQSSAREKIRAALAYRLTAHLSPALGYFNQFKACYVEEMAFNQVPDLPSIQATWGAEIYQNHIAGGGSHGAYHKQGTIDLRVYLRETDPDDISVAIERAVADLEKFFMSNLQMKDASGNPTCYTCVLEAEPLGRDYLRLPRGVADLTLSIYYRTSLTDPTQLI